MFQLGATNLYRVFHHQNSTSVSVENSLFHIYIYEEPNEFVVCSWESTLSFLNIDSIDQFILLRYHIYNYKSQFLTLTWIIPLGMSRTQFCMHKIGMLTLALVIMGAPKQLDMGAWHISMHRNNWLQNKKH